MRLELECHIRVSFRTAMARGWLMPWAKEYHKNGSDGVCGAMGLKLAVLLVPPPNSRRFLWRRWFHYPRMWLWNKVPVSVFLALALIGLFTWRVRSQEAPCWCKAVRERLRLAPFNSRIERERESLPLAARKVIRKSLRVRVRMRSC